MRVEFRGTNLSGFHHGGTTTLRKSTLLLCDPDWRDGLILSQPEWLRRMTPEDLRGLTPLVYVHINPYGIFELDMEKRLPLAA